MLQSLFEEIYRVVECDGGCGRAFKENKEEHQILTEEELEEALKSRYVVAKKCRTIWRRFCKSSLFW